MSKLEVGFAEVHNAIFVYGKSLGTKLDMNKHGGLKMEYDTDVNELHVTWGGKTARVPSANVSCYIVGPADDRKLQQVASPMVLGTGMKAQVETPTGHVHAGPGKGKVK